MKEKLIHKVEFYINKRGISEADVAYLFLLIRKILELDKNKKAYPCLRVYCNWMAHIEIDRTSDIQAIYNTFFSEHAMGASFKLLLWDDLRLFLVDCGIQNDFFGSNWKRRKVFENHMQQIVSNCPLLFPLLGKRLIITDSFHDIDSNGISVSTVGYKIENI
jgi:hypothetical protein